MQLVVDIPEDYYRAIKEIPVEHSTADMMIIRNGTPLNDVLDKISSDIQEEKTVEHIPKDVEMYDYIRALNKTLSIIDKHRTIENPEEVKAYEYEDRYI